MSRGKHLKKRLDEQDKTDDALRHLVEEAVTLVDENPEIADILKKAEEGDLPEPEALEQLHGLIKDKAGPKLQGALHTLASRHNIKLGYKPEAVGDKNVVMLNPLLEAALAERLQFDEDIPQLRSQENFRTAPVPSVLSNIQNPELLALALEQLRADRNLAIRAHLGELKPYAPDLIHEDALHLADSVADPDRPALTVDENGRFIGADPAVPGSEMIVAHQVAPGSQSGVIRMERVEVNHQNLHRALNRDDSRRTAMSRMLSTTAGADSMAASIVSALNWEDLLPHPIYPERSSYDPQGEEHQILSEYTMPIPTSLEDRSWNPGFDYIGMLRRHLVLPIRDIIDREVIRWARTVPLTSSPEEVSHPPGLLQHLWCRDASVTARFFKSEWGTHFIGSPLNTHHSSALADDEGYLYHSYLGSFQIFDDPHIVHSQHPGERTRQWVMSIRGRFEPAQFNPAESPPVVRIRL
jgi:hypothetical protein